MFERLKNALRPGPTTAEDVESDPNVARTRRTGGADTEENDSAGTTGTGRSGEFVGQVSGQDGGYAGETGAEARAEAEDR